MFERLVDRMRNFFGSWRFPAFVLFVLLFGDALMIAMLFIPTGPTGLGAFAEEFKIWCFGYDPATRSLQRGYVITLFTELAILVIAVLSVWWRPLREARKHPRALSIHALAALILVGGTAGALGASQPSRGNRGELPFPAERLRTSLPAPRFELINQDRTPVSMESLRGNVVMLTGVYARCGITCPMIMRDARAAVAALTDDERARLRVVAVTLDPANDTPERLAQMAVAHRVQAPAFNLVTGESQVVERTLDDLSIARTRDSVSGVIDHANVFVLVDRRGRVAYRLSIGERSRQWLITALRLLLRE